MPPKKPHSAPENEISAKMSITGINWNRWRPILAALGVAGMGTGGYKVASHYHDDTAGRIEGSRVEQTKELEATIHNTVEPINDRLVKVEAAVSDMGKQLAALSQQVKDQGEMRRLMDSAANKRSNVADSAKTD